MRFVDLSFGGAWCDENSSEVETRSGMLDMPLWITEHYIVKLQPILQLCDDLKQILGPLLLSPPFQSSSAHVILESLSMFVGQVGEFHGLKQTINNQSSS
jgi:hypothetical protein